MNPKHYESLLGQKREALDALQNHYGLWRENSYTDWLDLCALILVYLVLRRKAPDNLAPGREDRPIEAELESLIVYFRRRVFYHIDMASHLGPLNDQKNSE